MASSKKQRTVIAKSEKGCGMDDPVFKLTVFTGKRQLTKSIKLKDGKLAKATPIAASGKIKTIKTQINELPNLINSMGKNQCLIHGTSGYGEISITPVNKPKKGAIHRTKKYFSYPKGEPGLGMLDHDPDGVGAYFTPDDLVAAISEVFPQFMDAARVIKLSTSAEIFDVDGNRLSSEKSGYHIYFVATDASDLPRFKDVLFKRLWLLEQCYGHCRLSKAGSVLVRSVFDQSVFSPERCDFVSGAILGKGLEQRLPDAEYVEGSALDTSKLTDLTADEEAAYQKLVTDERERLKPEQEPVRREYAEAEAERTGETPEVVYQRLCAAEKGTINADTVVTTKLGEKISLDQMITDARNGEYIQDPTEDSDTMARLYIDGKNNAVVRSFLHGGAELQVVWSDDEVVEKPTFDECIEAVKELGEESSPSEISEVLDLAVRSKLDPIAQRKVFEAMKLATTMPLGDLKEGFAALRKEKAGPADDLAYEVAKETLDKYYAGGAFLVRGIDRCFWQYNGKHWQRHTDEQTQHKILSVVEETVDPSEASFAGMVRASLALIISMQAAASDILCLTEEPPSVINCRNGELWIAPDGAVELRQHRYDSYLPYVLDVDYDPSAICPRFDQALIDIFGNSSDANDMARNFEEFIGYTIQPRRDIAAWFMLRGRGRNGKTKLMETVERLINKRAIYSDRLANIEKDKFAIGSLAGKLLLIDDDVDTGTKLPDGFLKKASERKLMTGQLKFKDSFEFICTALPVMLANNYPHSADLSYGLRRRAHIIPFDRVFKDEDADDTLFPHIWKHELPGVLNRAIEGLARLRQRGRFDQPMDCLMAHEEWLAQANPLVTFIVEKCTESPGSHVPMATFYRDFVSWAGESGIRSIPTKHVTRSNIENLGYQVRHRNTGNAVYGLELSGHYFSPDSE
jgi:P4 family phage/plasmid primase-like protien